MKKVIVLAAALLLLLPVSAMAGMTAFMDMDELTDVEMAQTTGQTGITINATAQVLGGYVSWGDNDGCGAASLAGWLTLQGITASGLVMNGTTIDVCSNATTTWLVIGVPAMTIDAGVANVGLGPVAGSTRAILGHVAIGGLQLGGMTLQITGH